MIILINGTTHTGKTCLAQKMLENYKYPYLSIDHLKMGLIRSGYTDLTVEDDEKLTPYLWKIVKEIVKTAIENNQNLIIEGGYIPFDWRSYFEDEYIAKIRYICLAMSDEYIEKNFDKIVAHSNNIEKRIDDKQLTIRHLKEENNKYILGCQKYGENIVVIKDNYKKTIATLLL